MTWYIDTATSSGLVRNIDSTIFKNEYMGSFELPPIKKVKEKIKAPSELVYFDPKELVV